MRAPWAAMDSVQAISSRRRSGFSRTRWRACHEADSCWRILSTRHAAQCTRTGDTLRERARSLIRPGNDRAGPGSSSGAGRRIRAGPPGDPCGCEADHRADLEPLGSIPWVSEPQGDDRLSVLRSARLDEARRRVDPEPGERRPILVPAIRKQADVGSIEQIADPGELARVQAPLRLLVEGRIEGGAALAVDDREADRDLSGPAGGADGRQDRPAGRTEEGTVLGAQDRDGGPIDRVRVRRRSHPRNPGR